ncbi:MAG: alpha/beta hydrolase family esterase, partial [Pyrinomonadaceae bacterium]
VRIQIREDQDVLSAGGAIAVIMAAAYPDLFAAVGVHSGLAYKSATSRSEARPAMAAAGADPARLGQLAFEAMGSLGQSKHLMRVIVFQGTKDGAVSAANADRINSQWRRPTISLTMRKTITALMTWPTASRKARFPTDTLLRCTSTRTTRTKPLMEKWIVDEMKHAWSGGAAGVLNADPKGPDASMAMWRFFSSRRPCGSSPGSLLYLRVKEKPFSFSISHLMQLNPYRGGKVKATT